MQHLIDIGLEDGQSICQPKRYNKILEVAIPCTKSSLLLVVFSNPNLVVGIVQVKLEEDYRVVEFVKKLVDKRQQVLVLNSNSIKAMVINTKVQLATFLQDKENRSTYRAFGFSNPTLGKSFVKVFFQSLQFYKGYIIHIHVQRLSAQLQLNSIVGGLVGKQSFYLL